MLLDILPYLLAVAAALCVAAAWLGRRRRAVLVVCACCAALSACSAAVATRDAPLPMGLGRRAPRELKGGTRLVYMVEVDEAIKDQRDRYYGEIRAGLAGVFGFHRGDAAPTLKVLQELGPKLRLEKPRDAPGALAVVFVDPADSVKIDEAFVRRFARDLEVQRSADLKTVSFRIRKDGESMIRARTMAQVKETVQRRLGEVGLGGKGLFTRGGHAQITLGSSSPDQQREEARSLALLFQSGALAAPLVLTSENFFPR